MKKITILDRILLLATGLLAAYLIVYGISGHGTVPIIAYTIAFGVLLVAGLLLIILGFSVLDSPIVVVVSTIIPLALSLGIVWEYYPAWKILYLVFVIAGFAAVVYTRLIKPESKNAVITLAVTHGIAGLLITILPVVLAVQQVTCHRFAGVGVGGALIGVGGLLLAFLKSGKPILSKNKILTVLPTLLLLMTLAFVLGFSHD